MHPKADTTSHRRAPTRGCADLPHWRSAIRSKDGQYRILPRGAAFEAISGAGHRILLATGAAAPPGLQETCSAIFSLAPLCPRKHTATHLFQRILRRLQRLRRSVAAQRRVVPARVLANAVAQSVLVLVLRALTCSVSDAVLAPTSRRNGGASASAASGTFAAYETLNSSLALWHHAQLLASAVAGSSVGRALLALSYSVSDAVSAPASCRNSGASVSDATVMLEAPGTRSSSFAQRHHARMLANAVSQRAAWVLTLRTLTCSVSDAVSAHAARRNSGAPVLGQLGDMKHRGHKAAALRCGIMLGCSRMRCRREQREC